MAKDTRDRILEAALEIFANDGYAGTNIKDIADSVGIVKSALYRHFRCKEDIWNAVFNMMIGYYESHFGTETNIPFIPETMQELSDLTQRLLDFTIHDKKVILMRKILLTEQFRDTKVRDLASHYFLYDTEAIFARIFKKMMEKGTLRKNDAKILALTYTAPITALIHLCDREPDKEMEALKKISEFIRLFSDTYGT